MKTYKGNNKTNINIINNEYNNGFSIFAPPGIGNIAIYLNDLSSFVPYTTTVSGNVIKKTRTGIWVINASGFINYNIFNNNINYPASITPSATNIYYGIRLQKCNRVKVESNFIEKMGANPTLTNYKFVQGISTEISSSCDVRFNHAIKIGLGINITGTCLSSKFNCNILEKSWNAFFFNGANITDQNPFNESQANQYISTVSSPLEKLAGGVFSPTPTWYYNTSGIYFSANFIPLPSPLVSGITISSFGDNSSDACLSSLLAPDVDREFKTGDIVRNLRTFSANPNENRHLDKRHAYKYFKDNPTNVTLSLPTDVDFQTFMTTEAISNIGKLYDVEAEIENGNIINAKIINAAIVPVNNADDASKQVNEIYLNYVLTDTISSGDSSILNSFAYNDALIYGEAVYTARALLRIDPSDGVTLRNMENQLVKLNNSSNSDSFKIFPNPASNLIQVQILEADNLNCNLTLINSTGQVMHREVIINSESAINIESLSDGIYIVILRDNYNGDVLHKSKIIIQH